MKECQLPTHTVKQFDQNQLKRQDPSKMVDDETRTRNAAHALLNDLSIIKMKWGGRLSTRSHEIYNELLVEVISSVAEKTI